jgi:hypothetical protein
MGFWSRVGAAIVTGGASEIGGTGGRVATAVATGGASEIGPSPRDFLTDGIEPPPAWRHVFEVVVGLEGPGEGPGPGGNDISQDGDGNWNRTKRLLHRLGGVVTGPLTEVAGTAGDALEAATHAARPKPTPVHPVPTSQRPLTPAQRAEMTRLMNEAAQLHDLYQKARDAGSPETPELAGYATMAAEAAVRRIAAMMGLPPSYAARIRFDPGHDGVASTSIDENLSSIGWSAFSGDESKLVAVIAHEAAHLFQRDRDNLTITTFDAKRDSYESEATRIQEEYLRKLGYSEEAIRVLRTYSVDVKK